VVVSSVVSSVVVSVVVSEVVSVVVSAVVEAAVVSDSLAGVFWLVTQPVAKSDRQSADVKIVFFIYVRSLRFFFLSY
jgi:hypothetical protein